MFAGIVEEMAEVSEFIKGTNPLLTVHSSLDMSATKIGDSVAINGVCLTVVQQRGAKLSFELSQETLRRTNLNNLKISDKVNLERSLKMGDRIHGHFVFGHIDDTVTLQSLSAEESGLKLNFTMPANLRRFIVEKGSLALNGVSLTVGEVSQDLFSVYIIPHTAAQTVLGKIATGEQVNLEIDMLARYVLRDVA